LARRRHSRPLTVGAKEFQSLNCHGGKVGKRRFWPEKGFVFFSGGFVSLPGRLSFDLSTGIIKYSNYRNLEQGKSLFESNTTEESRKLTPEQTSQVISLVNVIWASDKTFSRYPPLEPIADFDVRLILCDCEAVRDIDSYRPPIDEVQKLYNLLWDFADHDDH
jgi:hypothetical protein